MDLFNLGVDIFKGTGFSSRLVPGYGADRWQLVSVTPREMVVRFLNPGPSVAVTLTDTATRSSASTSVQRPTDEKKTDEKRTDEKKEVKD